MRERRTSVNDTTIKKGGYNPDQGPFTPKTIHKANIALVMPLEDGADSLVSGSNSVIIELESVLEIEKMVSILTLIIKAQQDLFKLENVMHELGKLGIRANFPTIIEIDAFTGKILNEVNDED